MIYRLFLITLMALMIAACGQKAESKEMLFVCTHGAARSPIAAAYFNRIAEEKNLNYHAVFRGTEPDEVLSDATINGLTKDNFDVTNWKPTQVSGEDIDRAYKIVTFDCILPASGFKARDVTQWNGTPSISKDYDAARAAIEIKVIELTEQLIER